METINRRLDLLKMEGLGFSRAETVKELSSKYGVTERTVQYDFANRSKWQSQLSEIKETDKLLMKILNRYEQIYRNASRIYLLQPDANAQLGALNVMIKANQALSEITITPDTLHRLEQAEKTAKRFDLSKATKEEHEIMVKASRILMKYEIKPNEKAFYGKESLH